MGRGLDRSDVGGLLAALFHAGLIALGVGFILFALARWFIDGVMGLF